MKPHRDRALRDAECNFTADLVEHCEDCKKKMKPGSSVFNFTDDKDGFVYVGECCLERWLPK